MNKKLVSSVAGPLLYLVSGCHGPFNLQESNPKVHETFLDHMENSNDLFRGIAEITSMNSLRYDLEIKRLESKINYQQGQIDSLEEKVEVLDFIVKELYEHSHTHNKEKLPPQIPERKSY